MMDKEGNSRAIKDIAEKFIRALTGLESGSNIEQIVRLFADNCEVGNVVVSEKFRGIEGAWRFWRNYRDNFKDVCSIFQNETYSGNNVALEWITEGKIKNGRKIKYEGISILETEGEKIIRFYAYFDPKTLGRQLKSQGVMMNSRRDKNNKIGILGSITTARSL